MLKINLKTDFITLGQLLKFSGIISNGGEAKIFLLNNKILINGEAENRRGRKLFGGEIVKINDQLELLVVKK